MYFRGVDYIAIDRYVVAFNSPRNVEFGVTKVILYVCAIHGPVVEQRTHAIYSPVKVLSSSRTKESGILPQRNAG